MNRISLLAIGSLVFMACGGDDNNHHSAGVCGDGVVDSGEQCDDGNTSNGDGCSSTCQKEAHTAMCGDGVLDVATETCDDGNTTSGDGCSATCQTETVNKCGNGHLDSGEACDDNNTAGGDGCSATCSVEPGYMCSGEPSTCMVMTQTADGTCGAPFTATLTMLGSTYVAMGAGDTTNATNQVAAGACDSEDQTGDGHDQIWKIVNPVAQPVLITIHHDSTTFDAVLRLTTTACDVATEVPDDLLPDDQDSGMSDGCADLHSSSSDERLNYNNLAAGTYYLVVDGYQDTSNGMYSFSVSAGTAVCGNGVVEAGEACDDHNTATSDGCDASCAVETGWACTMASPSVCTHTCGNGTIDTGETCDDHNSNSNDGCSSACQTETGYTCTGTPSVCTATGGTCATPGTLTLTLTGTSYDGMVNGDTTGLTNSIAAASCDTYNSGAGTDQSWTFTNPVAQAVTITVTPSTSFDAVVRLLGTNCDVSSEIPDTVLPADPDAHADGCADRHASGTAEVLTYHSLPAGTYEIVVDGYSTTSAGMYALAVHGEQTVCGNGVVELGEGCDDHNTATGDGCDATCGVEPGYACTGAPSVCASTCGNGDLDPGEECDAGGTSSIRCDATCHLLFDTAEAEPNDTFATAQTITPAHHIISGSMIVGDRDAYAFTLTAPSVVTAETYTSYEQSYTSGSSLDPHLYCNVDTYALIFDSTGDVMTDTTAVAHDDDGGDGACSSVTSATLAPGTYYFVVHEYQLDDAIARYLADFTVTPM